MDIYLFVAKAWIKLRQKRGSEWKKREDRHWQSLIYAFVDASLWILKSTEERNAYQKRFPPNILLNHPSYKHYW